MSLELQFPDSRHNHLPRCCCLSDQDHPEQVDGLVTCPACPEHGELTPGVECPQCHQPAGRPHTPYCTLAPEQVWDGVLPPDVCRPIMVDGEPVRLVASADLSPEAADAITAVVRAARARMDARHIGQTSQPASYTTIAPPGVPRGQWLHYQGDPSRVDHRDVGGSWHNAVNCTPSYCGSTPEDAGPTPLVAGTPGHCHSPGCDRDYDQAPGPGCQTPGVHDNPR